LLTSTPLGALFPCSRFANYTPSIHHTSDYLCSPFLPCRLFLFFLSPILGGRPSHSQPVFPQIRTFLCLTVDERDHSKMQLYSQKQRGTFHIPLGGGLFPARDSPRFLHLVCLSVFQSLPKSCSILRRHPHRLFTCFLYTKRVPTLVTLFRAFTISFLYSISSFFLQPLPHNTVVVAAQSPYFSFTTFFSSPPLFFSPSLLCSICTNWEERGLFGHPFHLLLFFSPGFPGFFSSPFQIPLSISPI